MFFPLFFQAAPQEKLLGIQLPSLEAVKKKKKNKERGEEEMFRSFFWPDFVFVVFHRFRDHVGSCLQNKVFASGLYHYIRIYHLST